MADLKSPNITSNPLSTNQIQEANNIFDTSTNLREKAPIQPNSKKCVYIIGFIVTFVLIAAAIVIVIIIAKKRGGGNATLNPKQSSPTTTPNPKSEPTQDLDVKDRTTTPKSIETTTPNPTTTTVPLNNTIEPVNIDSTEVSSTQVNTEDSITEDTTQIKKTEDTTQIIKTENIETYPSTEIINSPTTSTFFTTEVTTNLADVTLKSETGFNFTNTQGDLKKISVVQKSVDESKFNDQLITTNLIRKTNYDNIF